MNAKQKETVRGLVAELRDVVAQEDRPKVDRLERLVGELRRERGELLTKVADLGSQRDSAKAAAVKAATAAEDRIAAIQKNSAQSESALRSQIAERNDLLAKLSERIGVLRCGLYPIDTEPLFITKEQLIRANQESIRLGYNRNIEEEYLESLPDQYYIIMRAYYHVGFSGREFEQLNYRLMLAVCPKPASCFRAEDMEHVVLDVSADLWDELRKQLAVVPTKRKSA
jgi:predicted  nucleic acid-binding Zn-ribbon protein